MHTWEAGQLGGELFGGLASAAARCDAIDEAEG
jgi:hypothetical protein